MSNLNEKLFELYEEKWEALLAHGSKINGPIPANPMLLSFDEEQYSLADKKIMICGQETWGWKDFGTPIKESMAGYHQFFIDGEFYKGHKVSSFWKAFRFFESQFSSIFGGNKIQFIWQNLSKIGRNDGVTGVTDQIRSLEREYFSVFKNEMKLLQPDVVIFLTGPNRDHDIKFHFPDAEFLQAGENPNMRSRAFISSADLPSATLRLYHPCYYRAWSKSYRSEALSLIVSKFRK